LVLFYSFFFQFFVTHHCLYAGKRPYLSPEFNFETNWINPGHFSTGKKETALLQPHFVAGNPFLFANKNLG